MMDLSVVIPTFNEVENVRTRGTILANDRWTWSETRKTEHTARSIQISIESSDQVWRPL